MTKENWLKHFIHASFWASSTSYAFFAMNFLGQIILARLLIPADFGIYAFVLAIREITLIFLGFATNQTFIQSEGESADFNASVMIVGLACVLFFIVALIGSGLLLAVYNWQYANMFILVCLGQVLMLLGTVYLAPLERKLNYKSAALIQGGASTLSLGAAILVAFLGMGLWSLALREVFQGLVLLLLALYYSELYFDFHVKARGIKKQVIFGMATAVSRGLEVLYYRFPDIIIQLFLGKIALGYFFQARYLAYLPIKLTTQFSEQVLFAYLTKIRENREQLTWHVYWINYVILRLLFPLVLIVYFFGEQLFDFIYGPKWIIAGEYFRYFSLFILFAAMFSCLQSACYSLGKQRFVSQSYLLAILFFAIGVITFAKGQYSALAFSIGMIIAYSYLLICLWYEGIKIAVFKLLGKPLIVFIIIWGVFHLLSLMIFIPLAIIAMILFYWYERKDLILLIKKIAGT